MLDLPGVIKSIAERAENGEVGIRIKNDICKLLLHILGNGPKKSSSLTLQAINLSQVGSVISTGVGLVGEGAVHKVRSIIGAHEGGYTVLDYIAFEKVGTI